jgi:hypothetical protein
MTTNPFLREKKRRRDIHTGGGSSLRGENKVIGIQSIGVTGEQGNKGLFYIYQFAQLVESV